MVFYVGENENKFINLSRGNKKILHRFYIVALDNSYIGMI